MLVEACPPWLHKEQDKSVHTDQEGKVQMEREKGKGAVHIKLEDRKG